MTFKRVVFPLTLDGVKSGCQVVFIPALSLFMITRLIAGNRVITLGTAIEQHFLSDAGLGHGRHNCRLFNYCDGRYDAHNRQWKERCVK